jgi:hypothetical protein
MKALLSHEPGGPESLRLEDLPDPSPGPGELLVRVRAAAINFPDVLIIEDKYQLRPPRPFAPGGELSGEIEAIGDSVEGWNIGDRIIAVTGFGSPDDITVNYFGAKGLKLDSVPYAKPGERYTSILGGHADLLYEQAGDVRNFGDTKQIRPVIFFYGSKVGDFSNVPVSKSLGYDITLPQFRVVLVKAGTDPAPEDALKNVYA